jgi:hypothetical protein
MTPPMRGEWLVSGRLVLAMAALGLVACARAPSTPAPVPPRPASDVGAVAWERLTRALPGTWTMTTSSGRFAVRYKLISNDSALVEHWGEGGKHETETVFHRDHADLVLTHYCAQGNQPRLRAVEASGDSITFRFVDVTNKLPDQSMLVERTLRVGTDGFDDTETYDGPQGKDVTTYHFVRSATEE